MFKELIQKFMDSAKSLIEKFKIALGNAPDTTVNEEGQEAVIIDGQEILTSDIEALDAKAEEIASTVVRVLTVSALSIISLFLVNEFFFWILIVIEFFVIYFGLRIALEVFTGKDEEVSNG